MDSPPDLRVLLVELARELNRIRPESVLGAELERVSTAKNTLLVLSRVLTAMAVRAGVSKDAVDRAVAKARRANEPKQGDMFVPVVVSPVAETLTTTTDWYIIAEVDLVLLKHRTELPDWFVNDFWPGCIRRAAQGLRLTDRERAIAEYQASKARGER